MQEKQFITTNIRLPKEYLKALKHEALQKEKSVSFLLRELVHEHLKSVPEKLRARKKIFSIWEFDKLAKKTGDPSLSSRIDKIVYGAK